MPQQTAPAVAPYTKKPVEILALAWTGRQEDLPAVRAFLGNDLVGTEETAADQWSLLIRTMERAATPDVIPPGWVLIEGVRGEHYACEPSIFAETYQPAHTS